jgi:hypothetical protein
LRISAFCSIEYASYIDARYVKLPPTGPAQNIEGVREALGPTIIFPVLNWPDGRE